ncbi:hypothetical protein C8R48DRAFT_669858 [Suillus tomentosus]|nr:hypothetical protein C8R48DRAFT_669858 [Suillus tomentosus]
MNTTSQLLPPPNSHCPKPGCRRSLPVKFKQGGINDGKAYLLCINPTAHSDKYWWIPPHWEHEEHSPPLTQGEVTVAPSPAGGHAPAKLKGCLSAFCAIKMVKAACRNRMCKSHCISTGGCPSHGFPMPSTHPQPPPSQTLPSAHPLPLSLSATSTSSTSEESYGIFDDFLSCTAPAGESHDVLDNFLSHTAPADSSSSWDAYPYLSDVDRNDQDLQAALTQSVADLQPPPPPPAQGIVSKPKKGKTQAPDSMNSEAGRRTLDPRLSTQLNDSWLATHTRHEALKTDFQQRAEAKKAHEQRLKGRFLVNYWDQNGADPVSVTVYKHSTVCSLAEHPDTLQALSADLGPVDYYDLKLRRWIQDDLNRPLEVATDSQLFIRRQGVDCKGFQDYLQDYVQPVGHNNLRNLTSERRAVRETRKKLGSNLAQDSPSQTPRWPGRHYHHGSTDNGSDASERQAETRKKLGPDLVKDSPSQTPRPGRHYYCGSTDNGSDVDISDDAPSLAALSTDWRSSVPLQFTPSRMPPDDSDSDFGSSITSLVQRKRFCHRDTDNKDSDGPSPSKAPCLTFSSNQARHAPSQVLSTARASTSTQWPTFTYTINMSDGFQQIESAEMKEKYRCLEDRFQAVFRVPFAASTYHDAKRHWLRASEAGLLEDAEAAGRTDAGRWSKLAAQVPLK